MRDKDSRIAERSKLHLGLNDDISRTRNRIDLRLTAFTKENFSIRMTFELWKYLKYIKNYN